MSFVNKDILIDDWVGTQLYLGPYDDKQVDVVLDANRCICDHDENCEECGGTGYSGDFEVCWVDESDKEGCNVFEYINYQERTK